MLVEVFFPSGGARGLAVAAWGLGIVPLDAVIHSPTRFSIMAALMAADKKVTKGQVGRRPRTWLSATPAGRAAFGNHLAVRNELATSSTVPQDGGGVL